MNFKQVLGFAFISSLVNAAVIAQQGSGIIQKPALSILSHQPTKIQYKHIALIKSSGPEKIRTRPPPRPSIKPKVVEPTPQVMIKTQKPQKPVEVPIVQNKQVVFGGPGGVNPQYSRPQVGVLPADIVDNFQSKQQDHPLPPLRLQDKIFGGPETVLPPVASPIIQNKEVVFGGPGGVNPQYSGPNTPVLPQNEVAYAPIIQQELPLPPLRVQEKMFGGPQTVLAPVETKLQTPQLSVIPGGINPESRQRERQNVIINPPLSSLTKQQAPAPLPLIKQVQVVVGGPSSLPPIAQPAREIKPAKLVKRGSKKN